MGDDEIELTDGYPSPHAYRGKVLFSSGTDIDPDTSDARPLLRASEENENTQANSAYRIGRDYDEDSTDSWTKRRYHGWPASVIAFAVLAALTALLLLLFLIPKTSVQKTKYPLGPYWNGLSSIENHFAFGDSWTTTHFRVEGEQPSIANPIGNPPFPGYTSTNGVNYVGYLATQYNHSFVKVFDMAYSGSTIDAEIDRTLFDWLDLPHQVKNEFAKYYTKNETGTIVPQGWTPENSLFSSFFGINDVTVYDRESDEIGHVFATYERLVGDLYNMSARNFLIINIPPMDKSPSGRYAKSPEELEDFAADVNEFNGLIKNLIRHLRRKHKDITIFEYDVHDLFERVIANPRSVSQTKGYKNTKTACKEYDGFENGAVATREQIKLCGGLNVEQHLWLNGMHSTAPVHRAMAAEIEKLLQDDYTR